MQFSSPVMTVERRFCPFGPHLAGPFIQRVSFISGHHLEDGTQIWQHSTLGLSLWFKCCGIFPVWQAQNVTNIVNHMLSVLMDDMTLFAHCHQSDFKMGSLNVQNPQLKFGHFLKCVFYSCSHHKHFFKHFASASWLLKLKKHIIQTLGPLRSAISLGYTHLNISCTKIQHSVPAAPPNS